MNPRYTSSVSHASQQLFTRHLLFRIILQYVADFYPVYALPGLLARKHNYITRQIAMGMKRDRLAFVAAHQ